MTKLHKTKISSMLIIGMLASVLAHLENAWRQDISVNSIINSSGSVLHGRTKHVADSILDALPGITQYNQVTNANQLTNVLGITGPSFDESVQYPVSHHLRVDDFKGLTNLRSLNYGPSAVYRIPLGVFDDLVNLQHLTLSSTRFGDSFTTLPAGVFDKLVNLQTLDFSQGYEHGVLATLPTGIFSKLANLQTLDLRGHPNLQLSADLFRQLIKSGRLKNLYHDDGSLLVVFSINSVLHGRPNQIADAILNALGSSITQYNQVTNSTQLSDVTSLNLQNVGLTLLQSGDFEGLTNLQTLNLEGNQLASLPWGYLTGWPVCRR